MVSLTAPWPSMLTRPQRQSRIRGEDRGISGDRPPQALVVPIGQGAQCTGGVAREGPRARAGHRCRLGRLGQRCCAVPASCASRRTVGSSSSTLRQRSPSARRSVTGTAPAVDEDAGRIFGDGVAANHDVCVAALLEGRIKDRLTGRAPASPGTLEISYSPLIHQIICHTNPLKSHAEMA